VADSVEGGAGMSAHKYGLVSPCKNCPFRTDIKPYITAARAADILRSQGEFHCHKTITIGAEAIDDEVDCDDTFREVIDDKNAQVCAGFLICLEHSGAPNQVMRIAERLGLYDRNKLRMDAPVYRGIEIAIRAHRRKLKVA
jgi:hypothetical protein